MKKQRAWRVAGVVLCVGLFASACSTPGGSDSSPSTDEIRKIAITPTDSRIQELTAAAQEKGAILVYTTQPEDEARRISEAFTEKYGVPVDLYRGGSTGSLTNRIVSEAQANKQVADVLWANDAITVAIDGAGLLAPFKSNFHADYDEQMWTSPNAYPVYVNYWMWVYNTTLVDVSDIPRSYQDLLDPRWRDELSVARYVDWFATMYDILGEDEADEFFGDFALQNPMVSPQFGTALQPVIAGERSLTISASAGETKLNMEKGAPIAGYYPDDPTPARTNAIGWFDGGINPEGALLFMEFLLDPEQGQLLVRDAGRVPASTSVEAAKDSPRPGKFQLVNYETLTPNLTSWDERFDRALK